MELRQKAALMALKGALVRDVNFHDIEDSLLSFGLISPEEKQIINRAGSTDRQTSTLVDILVDKNDVRTFDCLISSLEPTYDFLSKELANFRENPQIYLTKSTKDYEGVFIEGGIPITPVGNIELKYVAELKESLVKLSVRSDGGWILVKGHGGAGKSVVVSQAIRGKASDGSPIASYFFNRVFWFTIGNLRTDELESMLLAKMQNICIRLDPKLRASPPTSLDDAKNLFRKTMLEKYPCGLIVLDDVWEPKILRYFNVQARIVVTSRKADIFSKIQPGDAQRCMKISVDEGLPEELTSKLLTEIINSEVSPGQVSDSFNDEDMERVRRLHSKCKGNPFIVSIFGGLLRGRLSQFERYLKKFKTDLFKKVDLELGDYEYGSIIDAILVSIDDLDEEQKERYLHLSIFPEDTFLSAQFLSKYCWRNEDGNPLPVDDSLDVMEGFVRRSIATIEKYRPDEELLTLHDLIVSAMKSEYKEKRTSFNNQFVERVLSHRATVGSWMDVDSNDQMHYLAYNFVYHLVFSDAVPLDRKLSILRDFDFISWLCCRIGAENLTFVYQYSIKILTIDESARKSLTDFVEFFRSPILRIQATNLATRRSDSAVIQLALTLPEENSVRECAVEAAKKHRQFFCFYYWLNVDQTEEQIHNTFKVDSDVSTFALDRDCKHAVVASESSAVILDLKTGLRNFRVRKEDMACSSARGDAQDSIQIVSALFSPDNQSLLVLTEFALFRFKLPPSAFEVGVRPSPAAPLPSEKGSLHFPQGRPRSGTTGKSPLELTPNEPVYNEEEKENSFFTAMCFESDAKLLVGSSDGNIKVFTLADQVTNLSSEFDIDQNIPAGAQSQINHIAASQSMYSTSIAVSGPNDCVYVYKSRFDIKKYSGHAKNSNPIRCAFEPRPEPRFAASIANNEIHLWHPKTQQRLVREFGPKSTSFTSIAISSEGVYIAVGTSTRAHIYLYRVENLTESSCRLQLVDELNGSGSYTKCLAFQTSEKSFLYSMSEMSTEGVLTCWRTSLSTTPFNADYQRSSSIFFGPENATLRLRTVIDAVNVNGEIVVACQSVRRSLLILKSSGNHLQNDESGKLSGKEHPFSKAAAIRIAPTGNYAVFTFSNEVVIAKRFNDVWTFDFKPINVEIVDIVFLPNCQGFIGSNRSNKLVEFHDSLCVKQVDLSHKQLYSIDSVQPPANVAALLLFDRGWNYLLPDSLCVNENFGGSIGDQLQESLLCCNFCPALSGFVAGGTDLGNLILWKVAADNTASILATRSRIEDESRNCSLRCLQFSHQIIQDCYLLAAAFDDDRFSLWALRDGHLIDLVNCQPVQIGLPQQPSNIGCIAWTMHTDEDGTRHHKLIIASDCVHVCCLPEQEILGAARLAPQTPNLKLGTVSLYSRQSVSKVHVLNNGQDLLFVDNSHTVFWMRTLHSEDGAGPARQECSVPLIPFGESQEV